MLFKVGDMVLHRLTKEKLLILDITDRYGQIPIKVKRFNIKTDTYEEIFCHEVELEKDPDYGEETKEKVTEVSTEDPQAKE